MSDQVPVFPLDDPSTGTDVVGQERAPAHETPPEIVGPNPQTAVVFAVASVFFAALLGAFVSYRVGALAIALALAAAGCWRAISPPATRAHGIAVRNKTLDVIIYITLACGIVFLIFAGPTGGG